MNVRVSHTLLFGLALLMLFATPVFAYAASIYFAPASGSYEIGEQFSVNIFVSSDGRDINAVKATISAADSKLQLVSVSQAGSIIDFWSREPQVNGDGSVSFEGVMLGGGYSGSSGKLATIVLRARSQGDASLSVISGTVLANDGQGTALPTNLGTAQFTIGLPAVPPVTETIPDGFVFTKNLRQGDSGDGVTSLQICLRDQGFYAEDVTGYFGTQTKQAVIDFQEYYYDDILASWGFVRGTGLVQKTTLEKLNAVCFVVPTVEEPEQPLVEEQAPAEIVVEEVTEEIEEKALFYTNLWFWISTTVFLAIVVILLLLIIIVLLIRQEPAYQERRHKQALKKEKLVLRQAQKRLSMTKAKTEEELQKVENKLKRFSEKDNST